METLFFKAVSGFFRVSDVEGKNLKAEDKNSRVYGQKSRVNCQSSKSTVRVYRFLIVLKNDV